MTSTDEVQTYRLRRDGQPPLVFRGQKVAGASDQRHNSTRWNTARVYRTIGGRWVVELIHYTLWQGESNSHHVQVAEDIESLRRVIQELVPEHLRARLFEELDVEDRVD